MTQSEICQICKDIEKILQEHQDAINVHAEILGLHRYILEKFVPQPMLEAATKEYHAARMAAIAEETGVNVAGQPSQAN